MSAQKSPAPVTGADAPSTDAPVRPPVTTGDVPAPATTPVRPLTKADARRARAAEQAAKAEKAEKFTLDAGAEWHECVGKAEIGVCNSIANAAGESFLYVVYRTKGREIAIPVHALDKVLAAGDL
jgi:hypothetical protein